MARLLPITKGLSVIVDDDLFDSLSAYRWCASSSKGRDGPFYAVRSAIVGGVRRRLLMHRVILDAPSGSLVDHVNGDTLDNRRANLRLCTALENNWNRKISRPGRRGVFWDAQKQKWRASIFIRGHRHYLGCFSSPEEAAAAYDGAALQRSSEFNRLNFPNSHSPAPASLTGPTWR